MGIEIKKISALNFFVKVCSKSLVHRFLSGIVVKLKPLIPSITHYGWIVQSGEVSIGGWGTDTQTPGHGNLYTESA